MLEGLVALIQEGAIRPVVAKTFALGDLSSAQEYFLNKDFVRKIVMDMTL